MRNFARWTAVLLMAALVGCGGGGGSTSTNTNPVVAGVNVIVSPGTASVRLGDTQQFTATVTGAASTAVTWAVNGVTGGNATTGTINASGLYTAPATMPAAGISVTATSVQDTTKSGGAAVTLQNPIPVITAIVPATVEVGPFNNITIVGSKFVNGATVAVNGTNIATTFVSSTQLRASGNAAAVGTLSVTVTNPNPGSATSGSVNLPVTLISARAAARFLEQATFGPTPALVAHVAQVGMQAYLNEQFAAPASTLTDPASATDFTNLQQQWFNNAMNGNDQVRQRMAFALEQIWVISGITITNAQGYAQFLRQMQANALGNYSTIMRDVTLNPAMGRYLDMVNNDKPNPAAGTHANENYARELLQLFTTGTFQLNRDGTVKTDAQGAPLNTYDQATVQEFARVFTGWTYPPRSGATAQAHNPENYSGPMVAWEPLHDVGTKTLLDGFIVPPNQTAAQDLDAAMANIFNYSSTAPFVCKNLIQHFTSSNPSPAYVQRVVAAFENNGSGVRGDMKAVITAILLDPEARRGDNTPAASDGHLREPVLFVTGLLRAINATSDGSNLATQAQNMGQRLFFSGSVFNYFPPTWIIPGTALLGPEFNIQTTTNAVTRINFVNTIAFGTLAGTTIDVSRYASLAGTPQLMLDALDADMMHNQMSSEMRQQVLAAVQAVGASNTTQRARTAIYVIGSSSQFQVSH